jgi:hypothetical protein
MIALKCKRLHYILLLLIMAAPVMLYGQMDRGTITGTITDVTGAVIPGVKVVATNPAKGTQYEAVSNGVGIYNLLNLPFATYDLRFSKAGYAPFDHNEVALQAQQVAQINIRMQVGSQQQTVTVTGAPLLKMNTELGTNMTSKQITNLPLSANGGRDITSFAFDVTPTVSGSEWSGSVGGSQAFTKEVLINGTSADSGAVGHVGESEPPMDAVGQFQIDTSGISASAGRTGGGAFLFELKSGTNHFHGTAFGILASQALNSNTWENDYFRSYYDSTDPANSAQYNKEYATPVSKYHDWGVSGGFPLWFKHMFLYTAFERYYQANFSTTNGQATVPTTAFLNGDYSALLQKNQAPIGTDSAGNPIYKGAIFNPETGDVFPNNVIPQSMFSSVAQKVVAIYKKYYAPTFPARIINNYPALNNGNPKFTQTQISFNYDWDLTANNRINSSFIYTSRPRVNFPTGGLWEAGTQTGGPLTQAVQQKTVADAYRVSDAWTVTPNLLNVAGFTFNMFQNKSVPMTSVAGNTNWAEQIGLGTYQSSVPNLPTITFGSSVNGIGESSIGSDYNPLSGYVAYNGIFNDTVTWVHGRHNVHLGLQIYAIGLNDDYKGGPLTFNFSQLTGTPTSASVQAETGFGFANFLLGDVYSASKDTSVTQDSRRKEYALFGEDAFKITPKLTLDYALRWDIPMPMHVLQGHWSNFTASAKNPNFGQYLGSMQYLTSSGQTFETHKNFTQFSPHIGIAYAITNRLVLRGDYGMYYVPLGNNGYSGTPYGETTGYQATNQILQPSQANSYQFNWDSGYPGKPVYPARNNDSTYVPWGPASESSHALTLGRTQNWNINLQYQLGQSWVLHASYIGNIGRKLHDGRLVPTNWPAWSTYQKLITSGNEWDWVYDSSSAASAGVPYPYSGWAGEAYQAINPYPQVANTYGPIFFANNPIGQTGYNAMVLEVTKRTGNGLNMDLSYTLSKTTGDTGSAFTDTWTSGRGYQDPYGYQHYAKYPAPGFAPQVVKGFVSYALPFGHGQRFFSRGRLANELLGGWLASVIVDYQSGSPFGAVSSQNYYPGWSAVWANIASNANFKNTFKKFDPINLADRSNQFVDPSIFTNPTYGQLGNSPVVYSNWHTWGWSNEDASLLKKFAIGSKGRYTLTLRGEFFNVFNRHHWANPNLSMGSPYFGDVTGTSGNPRQGQVGARFSW